MASEQAWATKQAEELEDKLQKKVHKISGRQAAAERAVMEADAARRSGRPVRKLRGGLNEEQVRDLVDRLSTPKQASVET